MNNSPERRVNGYVISQSKIHFQDRQSFALCCCINSKKFFENKKAALGRFNKVIFLVTLFLGRKQHASLFPPKLVFLVSFYQETL